MTDPEPVALNEFNDLFRLLQKNSVYQQVMALDADDDCLCMGKFSCTNRTTPLDETKMSLVDRIELTRQQIRDLQHQLEDAEQELASEHAPSAKHD
jgi:RNase adaptor protein for sRNA GlmZ degradation